MNRKIMMLVDKLRSTAPFYDHRVVTELLDAIEAEADASDDTEPDQCDYVSTDYSDGPDDSD